ncbi:MAG TPA: alpha/beta hydrolase [Acidobacteriota bacterium]|jgi:alpha-L-fucosidase 2
MAGFILLCALMAQSQNPGLPFETSARGEFRRDIEFANIGGVSLTLDAWIPEGAGPFLSVIVVHGGGFVNGNKQTYVKPLFAPLADAGFVWFTINYRLAPQYRFPAAVEDVHRAIEFVKMHAREFKADPHRLALVGESAGGYLVSYACAENKQDSNVAAVVSFYGPHDFESRARTEGKLSDSAKAFFGVTELDASAFSVLRKVSPINLVKRDTPPFLLIHGTQDAQVSYQQSVLMCEKIRKAGGQCELYTIQGAGHGVGGWEDKPYTGAYKRKMVEWLRETLSAAKPRH